MTTVTPMAATDQRVISLTQVGETTPSNVTTAPLRKTWTDSVTFGTNVKGWRQRLRDGMSATTSMSGNRSTIRVTPGNYTYVRGNALSGVKTATAVGNLPVILDIPGANPSDLNDSRTNAEALGKFVQRAVAARSAIQGGVVLGELGQTLRMIRNPAQGLRRLADDWHRNARVIRNARRVGSMADHVRSVTRNLADAWLEVQFGWKPFLSDIRDGCKALDSYNTGQSLLTKRITARSVSSATSSTTPVSGTWGGSIAIGQYSTTLVGTTMVIYRGAVRVEARDPKTMDAALFGFSPEQFLPTAWELIPYSFLIDYFTNVGEIIAGWSSIFVNLAWCNRTSRKYVEETIVGFTSRQYVNTLFPDVTSVSGTPSKSIATKTSVSRAEYNGTLVPDLVFELPSIGSLRWLNIAALVASRGSDRKWSYD